MAKLMTSLITRYWLAGIVTMLGVSSILYSGQHQQQAEFKRMFFSHFGVALVSAGIVGVGYEMRASHKHMEEQVDRLIVINSGAALRVFPETLKALFRDSSKRDRTHHLIRDRLEEIVKRITTIEKQNLAANSVSVKFVSTLLGYTSEVATVLAEAKPAGGSYELKLPTPGELADEILSQQMYALHRGDGYRVISDFTTWDQNLSKFWEATKTMVKKNGISVKRVFCLYSYDRSLSRSKIEKILHEHWDLAKREGQYQLAVNLETSDIHVHIGVFSYRGQTICFEPGLGGNLAELTFSRTAKTNRFERCWARAIPALPPASGGARERATFEEFMGRIEGAAPGWLPK